MWELFLRHSVYILACHTRHRASFVYCCYWRYRA